MPCIYGQEERSFFLGKLCPFLEGRVKAEGESTHVGVFNLCFHGCLVGQKAQRQSS